MLGEVVILVMAEWRCSFLSSLKYPSSWQRSEAVDEVRPPRRVAGIGGFIGPATGVFRRSNVRTERSATLCVQLDGDSSWWRSSGSHLSLQRVAALAVAQR
jgi:hypothetical protein